MNRPLIALAASASLFPFAAPFPAMAGDFDSLDADGSGGLSYGEIRAAAPNVTVEEFVSADNDGSGELSREEFDAWKSASADPKE